MVNNQINKTQRIVPKDQVVVSTCTLRTFSTCRSVCFYGFNKSTCYCCFYGNIPSHFPSWDVLTVPWRHLQSGLSGNKGSTTQIVWLVHLCSLGHGKDSMKKRKLYFKMSKKQIGSFFIDLYLSLSSKSQKCESKFWCFVIQIELENHIITVLCYSIFCCLLSFVTTFLCLCRNQNYEPLPSRCLFSNTRFSSDYQKTNKHLER